MQPVLCVIGDPCLEEACLDAAASASAVDEILFHVADFGDVKVAGNKASVWKNEEDGFIGMRRELVAELGDVHGDRCLRLIAPQDAVKWHGDHCADAGCQEIDPQTGEMPADERGREGPSWIHRCAADRSCEHRFDGDD